MSYKKEVIAQMRLAVLHGMRASSETIEMWAKLLEQDEQQTPPVATGEPRAGESSVQPGAIAICMHAEADLLEVKADGESLSASMSLYGKAIADREIAEKAEREGWTRTR